MSKSVGTVFLVGAGPGDPGLVTLRAIECLRTADVVVYDRLAHPTLLDHARPDAERVYVGKRSSHHAMRQEEINRLLVDRALAGATVCRLKGGDPFVFGRGGEEALACTQAGVPFIIVPGVSSSIAAPAYAGIPVTHRDCASSFAVITGHQRDDQGEAASRQPGASENHRDWAFIAHAGDTLVFLMGVENLGEIAANLISNGREASTPAALVQWGTLPRQQVVVGTLSTIEHEAAAAGIGAPAVLVVGEVVRLRSRLQWFDNRPLSGVRVLVTRAREQASALSNILRERGADPVEFPVIRIEQNEDHGDIDAAIRGITDTDWIVFTSVNAVMAFADRLAALGLDARALAPARVAAIGPATTEALAGIGIRADFVPSRFVAETVVAEWPDREMAGKVVLMPRAAQARDVLPDGLRSLGARVTVIPIYRTVRDGEGTDVIRQSLAQSEIDVVTFTSSSTVTNLAESLGRDRIRELLSSTVIACIGPVTAQTATDLGITPSVVAEEHTIPGLVSALEAYLATRKKDTHETGTES